MSKDRRRAKRGQLMQDGKVISPQMLQAGAAHHALFTIIRFSESLHGGPRKIRKTRPDIIDIDWVWNTPPKGLPDDKMSPDLTVRIQYLENIGQTRVDFFLGPNCPEAAEKHDICKDTLDLIMIDMSQKGYLLDDKGEVA